MIRKSCVFANLMVPCPTGRHKSMWPRPLGWCQTRIITRKTWPEPSPLDNAPPLAAAPSSACAARSPIHLQCQRCERRPLVRSSTHPVIQIQRRHIHLFSHELMCESRRDDIHIRSKLSEMRDVVCEDPRTPGLAGCHHVQRVVNSPANASRRTCKPQSLHGIDLRQG